MLGNFGTEERKVYCGTKLDDDSAFCTNCGKILKQSTEIKNQVSTEANEESQDSKLSEELQDSKIALENLLEEEAKNHSAKIQYKIGECYYNGTGGASKDLAKAAVWFEKAAHQGHANAQSKIGSLYQNGTGVEKDIAKAKQWYKMAANNGVMFAKITLEKLEQEENARKPKHFCKNCGVELRTEAKFCTSCGMSQTGIVKKPVQVQTQNIVSRQSNSYNALCIAGFASSIVPLFFSGLIFSIIGLILSSIGCKDAINNNERGVGLATIGIILSIILLFISVIALASGIAITAGLLSAIPDNI